MEIIKSFRKTIQLKINDAWELIVKAPFFMSKEKINQFIEKNKSWVDEKKESVIEKIKKYNEWEKFMFFWDEYELNFKWNSKNIEFDGMSFSLDKKYKSKAKELFVDFYKKEARKYIEKRLNFITENNNIEYNTLKITSAKTRWGSCTSKRNINFTYRLIMAPVKTIDYVICHELSHLKYMNHSKEFWSEVDSMMKSLYPWNFRVHEKWLKDNWNKLMF